MARKKREESVVECFRVPLSMHQKVELMATEQDRQIQEQYRRLIRKGIEVESSEK
jgi:hypothetical protein